MRTETGDLWGGPRDAWRVVPTNLLTRSDGTAVMGAGVARQAAERYPDLPARLGRAIRDGHTGLMVAADHRVIALPTKRDWRDASDLALVLSGLRALAGWCARHPTELVRVPLLGAGLGRLPADRMRAMIREALGPYPHATLVERPAARRPPPWAVPSARIG